jgi:hypothetical protein
MRKPCEERIVENRESFSLFPKNDRVRTAPSPKHTNAMEGRESFIFIGR